MLASADTVPQASSALGPCQSKPYGVPVTLYQTVDNGVGRLAQGVLPEGKITQLRF